MIFRIPAKTIAIALALLASSAGARAEIHRGVWFWGSTTLPGGASASPFGSKTVVGDPVAEDETVSFFTTHGVKRVYGSYQNRPVSEAAVIAGWNTKLGNAGISSQLLLDGTAVDNTASMTSLLDKIFNGSEGVAWADAADRDAWYLAVSGVLDGISIMTFSKDKLPAIDTPELTTSGGDGSGDPGGGVVIFTGVPGYIYTIRSSDDMEDWGLPRSEHHGDFTGEGVPHSGQPHGTVRVLQGRALESLAPPGHHPALRFELVARQPGLQHHREA